MVLSFLSSDCHRCFGRRALNAVKLISYSFDSLTVVTLTVTTVTWILESKRDLPFNFGSESVSKLVDSNFEALTK